jgi:uncharacterized phage-associated protein
MLAKSMSHDVRTIANFVLKSANERGLTVTNMAMNKIVFLLHSDYLLRFQRPLTNAKIEAWEHGPVFRELYSAFKKYGDGAITDFGSKINPLSGEKEVCVIDLSEEQSDFLKPIAERLLKFSAGKLRQLSHLPGSPWDKVWNHGGVINAGMQISDDIILKSKSDTWRQ